MVSFFIPSAQGISEESIFELLVTFPALSATFEQLASAVPPWHTLLQVPVLSGPLIRTS